MCNIKTDWGIVDQQNGTTNIFIVPLRRARMEDHAFTAAWSEKDVEKNAVERCSLEI